MNNKYLLTLVAIATLSQPASAAVINFENKSKKPIRMVARYGKEQQKFTLAPGANRSIDSKKDSFTTLDWVQNQHIYFTDIICPSTMPTTGKIIFFDQDGKFGINFNANSI